MKPLVQIEYFEAVETLNRTGIQSPIIRHRDISLKLESQLPTGSYKFRGTRVFFENFENLGLKQIEVLSAGNLALAAASECAERGIKCRALVPAGISEVKRHGLINLGAEVRELPFQEIWDYVRAPGKTQEREFLHPFHPDLLAGYATIAHEILEQLPECGGIIVPYGLGGLTYSILEGLRISGAQLPVYVCEIEGYAPLSRALTHGETSSGNKLKSFIEAMGTPAVLPNMFEAVKDRVHACVTVTEAEVCSALAELHSEVGIQVEGAAAASYAASKKLSLHGNKNLVALLTGGNISGAAFQEVLRVARQR